LNPDPEPGSKHLSTSIEFGDTTASLATLMGVRDYFGLGDTEARSVLGETHEATAGWREAAASLGVDSAGIAAMESAFEHDQRKLAEEIVAGAPARGAGAHPPAPAKLDPTRWT
jgi:hypothetical protein